MAAAVLGAEQQPLGFVVVFFGLDLALAIFNPIS